MDLGLPQVPYQVVVLGGAVVFSLLVLQALIGYRKIHFKGRTHLKVHKAVAWTLLAFAAAHAFVALLYVGILS